MSLIFGNDYAALGTHFVSADPSAIQQQSVEASYVQLIGESPGASSTTEFPKSPSSSIFAVLEVIVLTDFPAL